jgi:hypothetical protein
MTNDETVETGQTIEVGAGERTAQEQTEEIQEQTQAYLDALTLRTRGEFDLGLAQSMQNVLGEAIRMVESQSSEADKATPGATGIFTHYPGATPQRFEHTQHPINVVGGYQHHSQPLREIYEPLRQQSNAIYNVVTHNFDSLVEEAAEAEKKKARERELSATRVLLAGGIPVATTAAGVMLVVASAATTPIVPNPYVALMVLIAGVGLLVTATVALKERRQRDD